ncbi:hypothetical protein B0O80DRAFT_209203 [Mortierella sp. GBAus27b]|nr:hypothetical protein B0O80DRAFT_209203 [Mortierella sp. GBAus27b]
MSFVMPIMAHHAHRHVTTSHVNTACGLRLIHNLLFTHCIPYHQLDSAYPHRPLIPSRHITPAEPIHHSLNDEPSWDPREARPEPMTKPNNSGPLKPPRTLPQSPMQEQQKGSTHPPHTSTLVPLAPSMLPQCPQALTRPFMCPSTGPREHPSRQPKQPRKPSCPFPKTMTTRCQATSTTLTRTSLSTTTSTSK